MNTDYLFRSFRFVWSRQVENEQGQRSTEDYKYESDITKETIIELHRLRWRSLRSTYP